MNTLPSYAPTHPFNASLLGKLHQGIAVKERTYIHVSPAQCLSTANSGGQLIYPRTALGTLQAQLITGQQNGQIQQILNKHHEPTALNSQSQLILLDSGQATTVRSALTQDANTMGPARIDSSHILASNPMTAQIMRDPQLARDALEAWQRNRELTPNDPHGHMIRLILSVSQASSPLYNQLIHWMYGGYTNTTLMGFEKYMKHEGKSLARLKTHFSELASSIPTQSGSHQSRVVTEARGEYASSKIMLTSQSADYQLKVGKSKAGRPNGIDQIWVKRNMVSGAVERYVLVEAKGSVKAHPGFTETGEQMSPRWVFFVLLMMAAKDASYVDPEHGVNTARKIITALINPGHPPVSGVMVKSLFGSKSAENVLDFSALIDFNFTREFAAVSAPQTNPAQTTSAHILW
ncbi:hypothetical protein ABKS89_14970 [Pseudomonas sp. LABIM340]|uniref:Uncharacterized protein n=1 Tax=Pseudomonas nitroreducens TaxID=46680 RepID=A0A5R9ABG2_PSENT|nr:hypothetical protein [Pseudomonas nitroreducens]TLP75126.1 hypothetical protein FEA48_13060 [Pseudomonas nitroreducens]